jgi:hypothetical protein
VTVLYRKDDIAFFVGKKSDNSGTLYFALQPEKDTDHWIWICPKKEQAPFLTKELSDIMSVKHPTQKINLKFEMRLDSKEELIDEVKRILGEGYSIEIFKEEENTILLSAHNSNVLLFVGIKPSIQYDHWYLFYLSLDQIKIIIEDLEVQYKKIDSANDKSRWSK